MECPNCGKLMKDCSYNYYSLGGWDLDYPDALHEEYTCRACKIKYINGAWTIPSNIYATEKQLKAGKIIEKTTGINMPPPLKKLLWKYIQDNIEASKNISKRNRIEQEQTFCDWCEDNSYWLPEYF